MDGVASVANVGAVNSQANIQVQQQIRVLKEQQSVAEQLGGAALTLIRSAIIGANQVGRDLDVTA